MENGYGLAFSTFHSPLPIHYSLHNLQLESISRSAVDYEYSVNPSGPGETGRDLHIDLIESDKSALRAGECGRDNRSSQVHTQAFGHAITIRWVRRGRIADAGAEQDYDGPCRQWPRTSVRIGDGKEAYSIQCPDCRRPSFTGGVGCEDARRFGEDLYLPL